MIKATKLFLLMGLAGVVQLYSAEADEAVVTVEPSDAWRFDLVCDAKDISGLMGPASLSLRPRKITCRGDEFSRGVVVLYWSSLVVERYLKQHVVMGEIPNTPDKESMCLNVLKDGLQRYESDRLSTVEQDPKPKSWFSRLASYIMPMQEGRQVQRASLTMIVPGVLENGRLVSTTSLPSSLFSLPLKSHVLTYGTEALDGKPAVFDLYAEGLGAKLRVGSDGVGEAVTVMMV